jgi:hypothetical protein
VPLPFNWFGVLLLPFEAAVWTVFLLEDYCIKEIDGIATFSLYQNDVPNSNSKNQNDKT